MADKRMTEDEAIATALRRHDHRHRRLGAAGASRCRWCGPSCAATSPTSPSSATAAPTSACSVPPARCASSSTASCRSTPSPSSPTSAPPARTAPSPRSSSTTRACSSGACYAASLRLPFLPTRAGLGSDVVKQLPGPAHRHQPLRRRRGARRRARPHPRRRPRAPQPGRRAGQRPVPRPRPLLRRPVPLGGHAGPPLRLRRADRAHLGAARQRVVPHHADQPVDGRRRRRGPQRRALHHLRARLRARRGVPAGVRHGRGRPRDLGGVRGHATSPAPKPTTSRRCATDERHDSHHRDGPRRHAAEICVVAIADAFVGDGEIFASGMGTIPMLGVPASPEPPPNPTCSSPTARPSSWPTTWPSAAPTRRSRAGCRSAASSTPSGTASAT